MTVSLIITTYNRPDALAKVLESTLNQTQLPNEIIIADDGSGDETRQIVEQFQALSPVSIMHCWQDDDGFRLAMIRNRAIAMATQPYLIMVDGDMVLGPDFISSHLSISAPGYLIQGSRVLLSQETTELYLTGQIKNLAWNTPKISNRLNAINSPVLSRLFSKEKNNLQSVRGCNMAFWREDVIRVNGFNEEFHGWGREDSEFVARMLNAGVLRKCLKFGGSGFHLYHPENTRSNISNNDEILAHTVTGKKTVCERGIKQYC